MNSKTMKNNNQTLGLFDKPYFVNRKTDMLDLDSKIVNGVNPDYFAQIDCYPLIDDTCTLSDEELDFCLKNASKTQTYSEFYEKDRPEVIENSDAVVVNQLNYWVTNLNQAGLEQNRPEAEKSLFKILYLKEKEDTQRTIG